MYSYGILMAGVHPLFLERDLAAQNQSLTIMVCEQSL